jgi:hypothetical protein
VVGARAIFLSALTIATPPAVSAQQVGMRSTMASVQLLATAAPRGSIDMVGEPVTTSRGGARESIVTLQGSANTAFYIVVRGSSGAKISVQDKDHAFHDLERDLPVTVVQRARCDGSWESEVRYRVESPENTEPVLLPVRYEMVLVPPP